MSINKAEQKQNEFDAVFGALSGQSPRDQKYIESKNKLLDNAKNFYKGRKKVIEGFKNKIFPIHYDDEDSRFDDNDENDIRDNNGLIDHEKLNRLINLKRRSINDSLFREYFKHQDPDSMLEDLCSTRNTERNDIQVDLIRSALTDFDNKIDSMSENDIRFEQPNEIAKIVEKILEFNRQQSEQGLKILTLDQRLNRLLISLAQLKAGNNSEKLKNEIRQILHSLYRSKKLTKNVYKNLVDII